MSEEKLQELFADNRSRGRKPSQRMEELEALIPDYVKRLSQKGRSANGHCSRQSEVSCHSQ